MSERPTPIYVALRESERVSVGKNEVLCACLRVVEAERADADRRVAERAAAIVQWLRNDAPSPTVAHQLADLILRGDYRRYEHLKGRGEP